MRYGFLAGFLAFKSASKSCFQIVHSLIFSSGGSYTLIFFEEAQGNFLPFFECYCQFAGLKLWVCQTVFQMHICSESSSDLE